MSKFAFRRCPLLVRPRYSAGTNLADFVGPLVANSAAHTTHVTAHIVANPADPTVVPVVESFVIDYSGPCTATPDTTGLLEALADFVRGSGDRGLVRFAVDFADKPQAVRYSDTTDIFDDLLIGSDA